MSGASLRFVLTGQAVFILNQSQDFISTHPLICFCRNLLRPRGLLMSPTRPLPRITVVSRPTQRHRPPMERHQALPPEIAPPSSPNPASLRQLERRKRNLDLGLRERKKMKAMTMVQNRKDAAETTRRGKTESPRRLGRQPRKATTVRRKKTRKRTPRFPTELGYEF